MVGVIRQCLTIENIGDLRMSVAIESAGHDEVELAGGLTTETPAPNVFFAGSIESLTLPNVKASLDYEMKQKAAATGLGGTWSKAFINTPQGKYILKKYPDFDVPGETIAKLEEASLKACGEAGIPAVNAKAIDNMVVIPRFDRPGQTSVCHLADVLGEQNIFAGSYEKGLNKLIPHISEDDRWNYTKQIIMAWVIGDSDKHSENIAMIRKENQGWSLAPVYDCLPSRFITGDKDVLGLTVNSKKNNLKLSDFKSLADSAGKSMDKVEAFAWTALIASEKHLLPTIEDGINKAQTTNTRETLKTLRCDLKKHLETISLILGGEHPKEAEKKAVAMVKSENELKPIEKVEQFKSSPLTAIQANARKFGFYTL